MKSGYGITNACVLNVENDTIHPSKTIIIAGEQIQFIGDSSGTDLPDGFEQIEVHGCFLMPGLIDSHVHYFAPATFGPLLLANGMVLVRDLGSPTEQAIPLREGLRQGVVIGPLMITAGSILDGSPPQIPQISIACGTVAQGREAVWQ